MKRRFLLDTNLWIGLANGETGLMAKFRAMDRSQIFSCSIVKAELMFGARKSQRVEANLTGFELLLEPFESAPFDDAAAAHYGILRASLERAGKPIGANDMLIAAIALSRDLVLATRNTSEFSRVAGLRLEAWL